MIPLKSFVVQNMLWLQNLRELKNKEDRGESSKKQRQSEAQLIDVYDP